MKKYYQGDAAGHATLGKPSAVVRLNCWGASPTPTASAKRRVLADAKNRITAKFVIFNNLVSGLFLLESGGRPAHSPVFALFGKTNSFKRLSAEGLRERTIIKYESSFRVVQLIAFIALPKLISHSIFSLSLSLFRILRVSVFRFQYHTLSISGSVM